MSAMRSLAALAMACALVSVPASAEDGQLAMPTDNVILTISGAITATNVDGQAEFDRPMLEQLGLIDMTTQTPWTDGRPEFRGVLFRDLLAAVGAEGNAIRAIALDDYEYTIPRAQLEQYPIMLAMDMNGEAMTPRDLGPIWIVYPRDEFPELDNKETDHRMVWQVRELIIE